MKKLALTILLMFSMPLTAGPIFKYGGYNIDAPESDTRKVNALTVSYDTGTMISPNFVHLSNSAGKNSGLGADLVFKALRHPDRNIHLMAGVISFNEPLNDSKERTNAHVGVGIRVKHFIASVDAYGTGNAGKSSVLFNAGVQF